ncbi:DUF423 domain-containing protein [Sphingomonas bacterium]|uniref:DUF423 domain-containing protein n=1 Tax=Sphingomonas bacterium TaxID=1895847 RepID=UPI0026243E88|nr:DUF423 domain-containing protein [Sphingomonas bacterium]MDB5679994.1 hypothetical protein [Sphingomonas bacterium]
MKRIAVLAALSGALAIGAGAFGAHWASKDVADLLKTGGQYQLIHAVAALVAVRMDARGPAALFVIGSALFAGSLYALALGAPRPIGAITPIGGLVMIAGWLWLAWRARR